MRQAYALRLRSLFKLDTLSSVTAGSVVNERQMNIQDLMSACDMYILKIGQSISSFVDTLAYMTKSLNLHSVSRPNGCK